MSECSEPYNWMEMTFPQAKSKIVKPQYASRAVRLENGQVLIFSGASDASTFLTTFHIFDPISREWSSGRIKSEDGTAFDGLANYGIANQGKKVYLFGGVRGNGLLSNDLYEFDVKTSLIRTVRTFGIPPVHRMGHSFIFSSSANKSYLFGGATYSSESGQGVKWSPMFDLVKGSVNRYLNDLYVLDFSTFHPSWRRLNTFEKANVPPQREGHSCTMFRSKKCNSNFMFIFGGNNGKTTFEDFYLYDTKKNEWRKIDFSSDIPLQPTSYKAIIKRTDVVLVFGGWARNSVSTPGHCSDQFYAVSLLTMKIKTFGETNPIRSTIRPSARMGHSCIMTDSRIWMFGGLALNSSTPVAVNDVWIMDIDVPGKPQNFSLLSFKDNVYSLSLRPQRAVDLYLVQVSGGIDDNQPNATDEDAEMFSIVAELANRKRLDGRISRKLMKAYMGRMRDQLEYHNLAMAEDVAAAVAENEAALKRKASDECSSERKSQKYMRPLVGAWSRSAGFDSISSSKTSEIRQIDGDFENSPTNVCWFDVGLFSGSNFEVKRYWICSSALSGVSNSANGIMVASWIKEFDQTLGNEFGRFAGRIELGRRGSYLFRVCGLNSRGRGPWSEKVLAPDPEFSVNRPIDCSTVSITKKEGGTLRLSWEYANKSNVQFQVSMFGGSSKAALGRDVVTERVLYVGSSQECSIYESQLQEAITADWMMPNSKENEFSVEGVLFRLRVLDSLTGKTDNSVATQIVLKLEQNKV